MSKQPVSYTCRGCGKKLKVPAAKIGSGVKCVCGRPISKDPDDDLPPAPRPATATRRRPAPTPAPAPPRDPQDADVAFPGMARSNIVLPNQSGSETEPPDDDEPIDSGEAEPDDHDRDDALDEPAADDGEPEPAPSGRATPTPAPRSRSETSRADRAAGRGRARVGNAALKRIAGLAPLFGVLLFLASGAIVYYYVTQGGAAVMATSEREAMFNAVFFGCLGVIGLIVLVTAGKLASGLVTLSDQLADLREELRDR